jgi:hypothetical protein
MPSIKKQVKDTFADRIAEASTHNLLHILRDERPDGSPMKEMKGVNLKARLAFQDLAHAELRKRGVSIPDLTAFFLMCDHEEA